MISPPDSFLKALQAEINAGIRAEYRWNGSCDVHTRISQDSERQHIFDDDLMYFDFHFTNALMSARTMTLGTQHIKAATVERASTRARPVTPTWFDFTTRQDAERNKGGLLFAVPPGETLFDGPLENSVLFMVQRHEMGPYTVQLVPMRGDLITPAELRPAVAFPQMMGGRELDMYNKSLQLMRAMLARAAEEDPME